MSEQYFFKGQAKTKGVMIFLLVGLLSVFGISLDILAGVLLIPKSGRIPHPYYHHGFKKNFHAVEQWGEKKYTFYTNSLGLKDRSRRKISLMNEQYRIVFIGDSFTEGIGFPYPQTFVGMVAHELTPRGIEVLNAGVASYSPKLYYLKMQYLLEVVGLKCDELMVYIDISDIQDEVAYETFSPTLADNPNNQLKKRVKNFFLAIPNNSYLRYAYRVYMKRITPQTLSDAEKTYYEERDKWTSDESIYQQWGDYGLHLAAGWMEKLIELCNQYQIKMTIAVYPWPQQILQQENRCKQVEFWEIFAQAHQIDFIDYFPAFIDSCPSPQPIEQYFIQGDVHWNEEGHRHVAQKFLDFYLPTFCEADCSQGHS